MVRLKGRLPCGFRGTEVPCCSMADTINLVEEQEIYADDHSFHHQRVKQLSYMSGHLSP